MIICKGLLGMSCEPQIAEWTHLRLPDVHLK